MDKNSMPKDIGKLIINTNIPVTDRILSFIEQVENPYVLRAGETVVEVEFAGKRSFSNALSNLLSG